GAQVLRERRLRGRVRLPRLPRLALLLRGHARGLLSAGAARGARCSVLEPRCSVLGARCSVATHDGRSIAAALPRWGGRGLAAAERASWHCAEHDGAALGGCSRFGRFGRFGRPCAPTRPSLACMFARLASLRICKFVSLRIHVPVPAPVSVPVAVEDTGVPPKCSASVLRWQ